MKELTIPSILHIEQLISRNQFGSFYALDVAVMSDGSKWEIPCAGNGNVWRKIWKSHAELQVDFEQNQLALMKAAGDNQSHGSKAQKQGKTSGAGIRAHTRAHRAQGARNNKPRS